MSYPKKRQEPCPYYIGQGNKRIFCKDGCFAQFVNEIEKNRFYRSRCVQRRRRCNIYDAINERERKIGGVRE